MKNNRTKISQMLSSCLILASTLGLFACNTANKTSEQKKPDEVVKGIISIGNGLNHSCLVNEKGQVYCWGRHDNGELGDGTANGENLLAPSTAIPNLIVKSLSSSQNFNVALTADGKIMGWGQNKYGGALNQKTTDDVTSPIQLEFPGAASAVEPLGEGACAINKEDSKIYCWGDNTFGELGIGSTDSELYHTVKPVASDRTFASLSTNAGFTACGITTQNSELLCWGQNRFGEIGVADHKNVLVPTVIKTPSNVAKFVKASAGEYHVCAISDTNNAYCWGDNKYGQLGNGTNNQSDTPQLVIGNIKFKEILATGALTCGLDINGKVYCWGKNSTGGLGDNKTVMSNSPVQAALPANFVTTKISLYTGEWDNQMSNICAVSTKGQAYCWGRNGGGHLGDGTKDTASAPVAVKYQA